MSEKSVVVLPTKMDTNTKLSEDSAHRLHRTGRMPHRAEFRHALSDWCLLGGTGSSDGFTQVGKSEWFGWRNHPKKNGNSKESIMKRQKTTIMAMVMMLVTCALAVGSSTVMAGNTGLICSASEAVSCGKNEACVRGPVDKVNLPLFFQVDFENQKVVSLTEAGELRTSSIAATQIMDGYTIINGTDVDTGWSMIISDQTGLMTLGVATIETGFTIFGACIDQTKALGDRK